jgi:hypothetical protein
MTVRKPFLVVYDYGQGGVWAFIVAKSSSEIRTKFPELKVVESPPEWMSERDLEELSKTMTFDLDDRRAGLLASIITQRGGEGPSVSLG